MASKKWALIALVVFLGSSILSACGGSEVEVTRIVKETVVETVVEKETVIETVVEKETVVAMPESDRRGGTIVTSLGVNVSDTLNQHISNNTQSRMVAHHVLDTLVAVNPEDGSVNPWLAASWEVSDDGKVYTFHLRDDVTFHDGTPFNAEAVKYNFDYTAQPDIKHAFAWAGLGADKYEKTEVIDDYTVKVYFNEPNPTFLLNLSDGGMGIDSPTAMEEAGDEYGISVLVGSGPFKFKEWVRNDHVTLVRNDDYNWPSPIFEHTGPAYLDELIYRDMTEYETMASAMEIGEIHVARLTESVLSRFEGNPDFAIMPVPKAGTARNFLLNMQVEPTNDIRVRQAVAHAVDEEGLLMLPFLSGYGAPGLSPLPSNIMPASTDLSIFKENAYEYDPEKAMALLEEAGWVDEDGDGIREKDGEKLVFLIPTYTLPEIEAVSGMLRDVGIDTDIKSGDFNFAYSEWEKREFQMIISSDSGYDPVRLLTYFFYSESPSDFTGYSNADAELAAASNALSLDEMWDNLIKAQAKILKDAVAVPGYERHYPYVANEKVQHLFFNEVAFPYFYGTWIDE